MILVMAILALTGTTLTVIEGEVFLLPRIGAAFAAKSRPFFICGGLLESRHRFLMFAFHLPRPGVGGRLSSGSLSHHA
jgi:hypothetical protein